MEDQLSRWITPFVKQSPTNFFILVFQCWVTLGVSLSMAQMGFVLGFSSVLVPQLMTPDSSLTISQEHGSWIASFPAIAIVLGNIIVATVMARFGRKVASISTLVLNIAGWTGIAFSSDVTVLLIVRCLQGVAMGMVITLSPLLIGEYTSPEYRGVFLMNNSMFISLGVMFIHIFGLFLSWKTSAIICIGITVVDLLIVLISPESPSWLSNQGRFEECTANFRWLRGDSEEDELEKMVASSIAFLKTKENQQSSSDSLMLRVRNSLKYFGETLKKREFNRPFIIMVHIYATAQWSGVNLQASYSVEYIQTVMGTEFIDVKNVMISLDIIRTVANFIALILIQKIKRRTIIIYSVIYNITIMFIIALYTLNKTMQFVNYDSCYDYYIGLTLIHLLTLSIGIGALPLSFILAGEIIPLQYKSMAGGLSCIFFSINLFINIKSIPFLLSTMNSYGMYLLHCCILVYLLIVVGKLLPETKDKTLQDIEEEFRGLKKPKHMSKTEVSYM